MKMPTDRWTEGVSGVGASGVRALLAWRWPGAAAPAGHPLVPMLTIGLQGEAPSSSSSSSSSSAAAAAAADVLLPPGAGADAWSRLVLERLSHLASGQYTPQAFEHGNVDFQLPRGGAVSL